MSDKKTQLEATEVKSTPATETTPAMATSTTTTTTTTSAPASEPKKGRSGLFKCCVAGCVVLLLCCVCTVVFALVAPNLLIKTLTGGNKAPDPTLTRITTIADYKTVKLSLDDGFANSTEDPATGFYSLKMSEKEAIAFAYQTLNVDSATKPLTEKDVSKLGVKFTPNQIKIECDLSLIFSTMPKSETSNFDPSVFDGVNVSVTLGVKPDKKGLQVTDFSSGNSIIDNLMTGQFKSSFIQSFEEGFNNSSDSSSSSTKIEQITVTQGYIELLMSSNELQFETP